MVRGARLIPQLSFGSAPAFDADAGTRAVPSGWVVTDQSPAPGTRVVCDSTVRVQLEWKQ
jgi:hypothetical protein